MELMKIKRLTPAMADWRARFKVPSTLTLRYSVSGSATESFMMWARAAVWMTTCWLERAVDQSVRPSISAILIVVAFPTRNEARAVAASSIAESEESTWVNRPPRKPVEPLKQTRCCGLIIFERGLKFDLLLYKQKTFHLIDE